MSLIMGRSDKPNKPWASKKIFARLLFVIRGLSMVVVLSPSTYPQNYDSDQKEKISSVPIRAAKISAIWYSK